MQASCPNLPPPGLQFFCTAGPPAAEAWAILAPDEQARANRFHFERDRSRWINGRAWIRRTLAPLLGLAPQAVNFAAEPGGRLYLPGAALDFNLSHTGDWIALATSTGQGCRVGVDLETIDPQFPSLEIAAEYFLPEECQWLAAGTVERFFHLWTAKEALMKATGQGMSLPPDKIRVAIRDGQPATVTNLETGATHPVTTRPGPGSTLVATVHIHPD